MQLTRERPAVVDPDAYRAAMFFSGLLQCLENIAPLVIEAYADRRAHLAEHVDYVQNPEPLTVEQLICHEVHGPGLAWRRSWPAVIAQLGGNPTLRRLVV